MPKPQQKGSTRTKRRKRKLPSLNDDRQPGKNAETNRKFSIPSFLFGLGFLFLLLITLLQLSKSQDFSNPRVIEINGLIPFHYGIFIVIACAFLYFAIRVLDSGRTFQFADKWSLLIAFVSITTLYITAFKTEISPNGDNAEYLIVTKSLVEKGGVYRLDTPNETPNSLASLGLPFLLAPLYAIWGFDIIKMKLLILALGISLFPLLFTLFRKFVSYAEAALLTILCYSSPYLVGMSSVIMTETPYLFWSILGLLLIVRYIDNARFSWKEHISVMLVIIMIYLTRAIGIALFAALMLTIFFRLLSKSHIKEHGWFGFSSSSLVKKFIYLIAPIAFLIVAFQLYQGGKGVSQFSIFIDVTYQDFLISLDSAYRVITQLVFSAETFRWANFSALHFLPEMNMIWLGLLVIFCMGIVSSIKDKEVLGIYMFTMTLLIVIGTRTPAEMVILRYLSILTPIMIYLFYKGGVQMTDLVANKIRFPQAKVIGKLLTLLLMSQILFTNFSGATTNIALRVVGNGPNYDDYYDVAKWSARNLPDDAVVLSIKPRLFYLYSGKKGGRITHSGESYSEEFVKEKLASFRRMKATHIVIDHISAYSRLNIFPIVENNPSFFTPLYIAGISGTSSILRIEEFDDNQIN